MTLQAKLTAFYKCRYVKAMWPREYTYKVSKNGTPYIREKPFKSVMTRGSQLTEEERAPLLELAKAQIEKWRLHREWLDSLPPEEKEKQLEIEAQEALKAQINFIMYGIGGP